MLYRNLAPYPLPGQARVARMVSATELVAVAEDVDCWVDPLRRLARALDIADGKLDEGGDRSEHGTRCAVLAAEVERLANDLRGLARDLQPSERPGNGHRLHGGDHAA